MCRELCDFATLAEKKFEWKLYDEETKSGESLSAVWQPPSRAANRISKIHRSRRFFHWKLSQARGWRSTPVEKLRKWKWKKVKVKGAFLTMRTSSAASLSNPPYQFTSLRRENAKSKSTQSYSVVLKYSKKLDQIYPSAGKKLDKAENLFRPRRGRVMVSDLILSVLWRFKCCRSWVE